MRHERAVNSKRSGEGTGDWGIRTSEQGRVGGEIPEGKSMGGKKLISNGV